MSSYEVLGFFVTPIIVERDGAGNIVGQQSLHPQMVHFPFVEGMDRLVAQTLAAVKPAEVRNDDPSRD